MLSPLYTYAWSKLHKCGPSQHWLLSWEAGPSHLLEGDSAALWRLSQGWLVQNQPIRLDPRDLVELILLCQGFVTEAVLPQSFKTGYWIKSNPFPIGEDRKHSQHTF
jgi:hypothetical protein